MSSPESIKQEILEKSGTRIPTCLTLEEALQAPQAVIDEDFEPGDDDPNRVIESAEIGMTFSGSGELALTPHMRKRLDEIAETE